MNTSLRCVAGSVGRTAVAILTVLTALFVAGVSPANASGEANWYDFFWPLGEPVLVEALKEEYVPFKTVGDIPSRPGLFIELGDPSSIPVNSTQDLKYR